MLRGLQCRSAMRFLHLGTVLVLAVSFVMLRVTLDKPSVTCYLSTNTSVGCIQSVMTLAVCCRQPKDLDPMWAPLPPGLHL